jgi:Nucleoside H+ symporter
MQSALTSTFAIAGVASLMLSAFSLTLPHTPPPKSASSFAPIEAFKLLRIPAILVLFVVTFLDALVHYQYFFWTSRYLPAIGLPENWVTPAMSIGQIAEMATMAGLGWVLKRLGWRTTMVLGLLGHVIRFGIYAIGTPDTLWLVILSNVVHGFAYAFFFATVYIIVDETFPKDLRTSGQSLFNLLILGLGPLASNILSARLGDAFLPKRDPTPVFLGGWAVDIAQQLLPKTDAEKAMLLGAYHKIFLVPLALGAVATLILAIFFRPPAKEPVPEEVPVLVN